MDESSKRSRPSSERLKVAIDCRISDPRQGIGTALLALAHAFSKSEDIGQRYDFIVPEELGEWLTPHVFGQCNLKILPGNRFSVLKKSLKRVAPLRALWRSSRGVQKRRLAVSDGYVEAGGYDVVHFPTQAAYLTELPSIYQPHDLQHLHHPEFFSTNERAQREREYRAFCDRATYVCVHTEWSKQDLIRQYGLAPEKIAVIEWGSVFESRPPLSPQVQSSVAERFALPARFFFYPAATWAHKNHEVIFRALHLLKSERNTVAEVVFTGASTPYRSQLDRLARELGIFQQVHYLGFVTAEELQAIFRSATALVYASKFEGFGLPIIEAFEAGLPVLSSNATVLPEVAGGAALYFDPNSPQELAELMMQIFESRTLREGLAGKGKQRLPRFSFVNAAAKFQRLYTLTAQRQQGAGAGK